MIRFLQIFFTLGFLILIPSGSLLAQPKIVINKFQNNNDTNATAGVDAFIVELLVIQDSLDLRNVLIKDFSANGTLDNGGAFRFASTPYFSSFRSGTLIVLKKQGDFASNDTNKSDFVVTLALKEPVADQTTDFSHIKDEDIANFRPGLFDYIMIKKANEPVNGVSNWLHVFQTGRINKLSPIKLAVQAEAASRVSGGETADTLTSILGAAPTGEFCTATNSTSSASDYVGADAQGAGAESAFVFGEPSNATNGTFITALRNSIITTEDPAYVTNNQIALKVFPSPVAPGTSTTVTFNLSSADVVSIDLLNLSGCLVAQPLSARQLGAGENRVTFDIPAGFTEGLHYLRLSTQNAHRQGFRKLLIINW